MSSAGAVINRGLSRKTQQVPEPTRCDDFKAPVPRFRFSSPFTIVSFCTILVTQTPPHQQVHDSVTKRLPIGSSSDPPLLSQLVWSWQLGWQSQEESMGESPNPPWRGKDMKTDHTATTATTPNPAAATLMSRPVLSTKLKG